MTHLRLTAPVFARPALAVGVLLLSPGCGELDRVPDLRNGSTGAPEDVSVAPSPRVDGNDPVSDARRPTDRRGEDDGPVTPGPDGGPRVGDDVGDGVRDGSGGGGDASTADAAMDGRRLDSASVVPPADAGPYDADAVDVARPDGGAPDTARPDAAQSDAAACALGCPGAAPPTDFREGVCAAWLRVCDPATCTWVEAAPNDVDLPAYEVVETQCDGLDNDCDGLTDEAAACIPLCIECQLDVLPADAETLRGPLPEAFAGGCAASATAGWHTGPQVNDITLRWTHTADCPALEPGSVITDYPGRWARWHLDPPLPGHYSVRMRVPDPLYLCLPRVLAPRIEVAIIDRATGIVVAGPLRVVVPAAGDVDITAFDDVPLADGEQDLVLLDRQPNSVPCGLAPGAPIPEPTPPVVFVDRVSMTFLGPE